MPTVTPDAVVTDLLDALKGSVESGQFLQSLVLAALVMVLGYVLSKVAQRATVSALARVSMEPTVRRFLGRVAGVTVLAVTAVMALDLLGVPTATLVAVVGAAGLALGLALQDTLANAASGLLLITLQPYRVGDFVDVADGVRGTVVDVGFFHTALRGRDNRSVLVPNKLVMANTILNYTSRGLIRLDIDVGVAYDTDLRKARAVIQEVFDDDPRIARDPPAIVAVKDFGDSSLVLTLRPYVPVDDEIPVTYDVRERVKLGFDKAGIVIPFPHRVLHMPEPATAD